MSETLFEYISEHFEAFAAEVVSTLLFVKELERDYGHGCYSVHYYNGYLDGIRWAMDERKQLSLSDSAKFVDMMRAKIEKGEVV